MKNNLLRAASIILFLIAVTMICGCGRNSAAADTAESVLNDSVGNNTETEAGIPEKLSDEQAISAVRNYCFAMNPALKEIIKETEYQVYWVVSSSDEQEIVVLFRSYTGAQNRYYIDRITGETYVTEFVPGITDEEQRSNESFNVRDYS